MYYTASNATSRRVIICCKCCLKRQNNVYYISVIWKQDIIMHNHMNLLTIGLDTTSTPICDRRNEPLQDLVVPIMISLIEGCCLQGSYWTKCSYCLNWNHHFERFMVNSMDNCYGILCVTNDHRYVPLVSYTRSFPHSGLIIGFTIIE